MTISRKKHLQIVTSLGLIILCLIVLIIGFYFENKIINRESNADLTNLRAPDSPFLNEQEAVIVNEGTKGGAEEIILPIQKVLFEYVEVTESCGPHYEGDCLLVRSGPGTEFPIVSRLRNGVVLKIGGEVERDGAIWYKIVFDEWLRYPERVNDDWYISADYVDVLLDEGDKTTWEDGSTATTKKIVISRSEQKLYAYEEDQLFLEISISTGLELTPTPRGTFTIFKKTPSRYMQGPVPGLPDNQTYDLPGVPWNLYFTHEGAVIHGAYWHNSFGAPYSHGCVNLSPEQAQILYIWADLGTQVVVKD